MCVILLSIKCLIPRSAKRGKPRHADFGCRYKKRRRAGVAASPEQINTPLLLVTQRKDRGRDGSSEVCGRSTDSQPLETIRGEAALRHIGGPTDYSLMA